MGDAAQGALITLAGGVIVVLVTWLLKRRPAKETSYDQLQEDISGLRKDFSDYKKQAAVNGHQQAAEFSEYKKQAAADLAQTRLEVGHWRGMARLLDNEVVALRQGVERGEIPPLPPRPPWPSVAA